MENIVLTVGLGLPHAIMTECGTSLNSPPRRVFKHAFVLFSCSFFFLITSFSLHPFHKKEILSMTVYTNGKISKTTASTSGSSAVPIDIRTNTKRRTKAHPHPYLADNFYPVFEETVGDEGIECQVVGTLPSSLSKGQYVRTGPNSIDVPADTAYHHWFDGAGLFFLR